MRNTIVASITVPFLMIGLMTGFVGCKMAPKMPWSKTAATADVETATLAHSAPALPADIAKQAEALAATTPSIDLTAPQSTGGLASGGQAAPYSTAPAYSPTTASLAATSTPSLGSGAKTAPTAYPSTGASSYSTAPAPTTVATTPSVPPAYQVADQSANLGAVDMPYNPNAVPPAKTVASTATVTPTVGANRYGASPVANSAPAYGGANTSPNTTAAVPQYSGSGRYGRYESSQNATTSPATPASSVNLASTGSAAPSTTSVPPVYGAPRHSIPAAIPAARPAAQVSGDRYAAINNAPTAPSVTQNTPPLNSVTPTVSAPSVANAPAYRPGGTTSYARLATRQPVAEIATRPNPVDTQVPNVAAPSSTPNPTQAPRYR